MAKTVIDVGPDGNTSSMVRGRRGVHLLGPEMGRAAVFLHPGKNKEQVLADSLRQYNENAQDLGQKTMMTICGLDVFHVKGRPQGMSFDS